MKVSVALCTYNGSRYLTAQLDSILHQSRPVDEVIICDDLSTDSTKEIVGRYVERFSGIVQLYINEVNLGGKLNFEKAFSLCTGDLIFFSDQDDLWEHEKVDRMLALFEQQPASLGAFSDAHLIDGSDRLLPGSFWQSYQFGPKDHALADEIGMGNYLIAYGNIVAGSMMAVRKEAKAFLLPFRLMDHMWHDEWIALSLSARNTLVRMPEKLVRYRLHEHQQIGGYNTEAHKEPWGHRTFWKDLHNIRTHTLPYFNYTWYTWYRFELILKAIPEFAGSVTFFKTKTIESKRQLLRSYGWFHRKLRVLKWLASRKYDTSYRELFRV